MDVRQLRYFTEIVDARSFTRAAERVRVAQPALGLQVKKLEEELGVSLLRRHSRGVEPTEAGVVLLKHANAVLKQIEQARQELTDLSGPPRGEIVLGITPTASALLATDLVKACHDAYPDIALNVVEGLSESIMTRLAANSIDMGFSYNPSAVRGITTEPLMVEELYLVSPAGTGVSDDTVSLADALRDPLILPSEGFGLRECVEDAARDGDLQVRTRFEIDSVATMRDLVEAGLGSTILPYAAVKKAVEAGHLIATLIVRPRITRTLHLAFASAYTESNASKAVRKIIDDVIAERVTHGGGRFRHSNAE